MSHTAYLAPRGFEAQLEAELRAHGLKPRLYDRLFVTEAPAVSVVWCHNVWYDAELLTVRSIGDAAKQLKARQRNWWPYAFHLHRRTELIQEQLPHVSAKPLAFPAAIPAAPLGSWTLLEEGTMLAAAHCSSPFPNGEPAFEEYKVGPPSRAYLKLFEALTKLGVRPAPGERCLELGASPGGWTWVLARLGTTVEAVDRAPLDPMIASMQGVTWRQGDAFALKPDPSQPIDWLLSDVICYPERLLAFVKTWVASGACRRFVCTVKFQGDGGYEILREFAQIAGSQIVHLYNNKHEVTWARL